MAIRMAIACGAPGPMGTAWRRTRSGELTTSTSGSSSRTSSAFQVPCSSMVSPACSSTFSLASLVRDFAAILPPLQGKNDQVAACSDHAWKHGLPDQARTRRDHDLRKAGSTVEQRLPRREACILAKREMHVRPRALRPRPLGHATTGGRLPRRAVATALPSGRPGWRRVAGRERSKNRGGRCCADVGRARRERASGKYRSSGHTARQVSSHAG